MKALRLAFATLALSVASPAAAITCMKADAAGQIAQGRLSVGRFQDAADRPETAYILTLPVPTCLASSDPDGRVDTARTIHIYASSPAVHAGIRRFVGHTVAVRGRPFAAHTSHHHAPIVMDISEIDEH
jgi:Domain of unknown function (DUF4431)